MAPTTLADALGGLRITGAENPYGMGLIALNQAAPNLYNPYGKPAGNFGIALGQALLSGLLGYQAKKQATEESLQATDLATQLLAKPATERTTFLQGLQQQDVPANVMGRLTEISPAILLQENLVKSQIDQEVAKKKALAEFELGDVGSKLFERSTQADIDKALAVAGATRTRQPLPTGVNTAITEASIFADAAKAQRNRIAELDPIKLKAILTTGVNLGESGFNQTNEAIVQLYRKANFGATLTGQEKKAADLITGKNLTATKADILSAWDTLIDLSNKRAQRTVDIATSSPEQIKQMFGAGAKTETPGGESEAVKKNRELKERLARLEALATQRK